MLDHVGCIRFTLFPNVMSINCAVRILIKISRLTYPNVSSNIHASLDLSLELPYNCNYIARNIVVIVIITNLQVCSTNWLSCYVDIMSNEQGGATLKRMMNLHASSWHLSDRLSPIFPLARDADDPFVDTPTFPDDEARSKLRIAQCIDCLAGGICPHHPLQIHQYRFLQITLLESFSNQKARSILKITYYSCNSHYTYL